MVYIIDLQLPGQIITIKGGSLFWWKTRGFSECISGSVANVSEVGQIEALYHHWRCDEILRRCQLLVVQKVPIITLLYVAAKFALLRIAALRAEESCRTRKRSATTHDNENDGDYFSALDVKQLVEVDPINNTDKANDSKRRNGRIMQSLFNALYPLLHTQIMRFKSVVSDTQDQVSHPKASTEKALWCSNPQCRAELFMCYESKSGMCMRCFSKISTDCQFEIGSLVGTAIPAMHKLNDSEETARVHCDSVPFSMSGNASDDYWTVAVTAAIQSQSIQDLGISKDDMSLLSEFSKSRKLEYASNNQKGRKYTNFELKKRMNQQELEDILREMITAMKDLISPANVKIIRSNAELERRKLASDIS